MASVLAISIHTIAIASTQQNHRKSVIYPIKYSGIHKLDMMADNRPKEIPDSLGGSCDVAGRKD